MNLRKLHYIIFATFAALSVLSCKKDKETVLPSIEGTLKFTGYEMFVSADYESRTLTLKPSGAKHPDGKGIGYYWKVSPTMSSYDTTRFENGLDKNGQPSDGTFKYTLKDSLGTYTIYCYAFAKGYTASSASAYVTVVRGGVQANPDEPEVSITNNGITEKCTSLEGTGYYYTTVGNYDWIANNISDNTGGATFYGYKAMGDVFGRYYSYDEAKSVCANLPANGGNTWRLPTDQDWVNLVKDITKDDVKGEFKADVHSDIYWDIKTNGKPSLTSRLAANASFNGTAMWNYWPAVGSLENTSGMSIIPTGYTNLGVTPELKSNYPGAIFDGAYEYAAFWTADEVEGETEMAYYRYMYEKDPHLMIGKGYKSTFGASVRCVRDSN